MQVLQTALTDPDDQVLGPFMTHGVAAGIGINLVRTAGAVVVTILGYDEDADETFVILASASLDATGYTWLSFGEGIESATNVAANVAMPSQIKIDLDETDFEGTIAIHGEGVSPQRS